EDEEESFEAERQSNGLLVFVKVGSDVTFVDPLREGGLAAYNFHVEADASPSPDRLRGFVHTDRGLYRPGDTVHIKGLARTLKLGEGLRVPEGRRANVEVTDPRGNMLVQKGVALSRFGGFSLDVPLGSDARLGDYGVSVSMAQGSFHHSFAVEEYRPASFEVKLSSGKPHYVAKEKLKL